MDDLNSLIETSKELEELVTDSNLLNDKNIVTDSLVLTAYDENTPVLASEPQIESDKDKETENATITNLSEEVVQTDDDPSISSNKENEIAADLPFQAHINKPCQFAVSRIKTIMKLDPDLSLVSKESVFLIAKATVNTHIYN